MTPVRLLDENLDCTFWPWRPGETRQTFLRHRIDSKAPDLGAHELGLEMPNGEGGLAFLLSTRDEPDGDDLDLFLSSSGVLFWSSNTLFEELG